MMMSTQARTLLLAVSIALPASAQQAPLPNHQTANPPVAIQDNTDPVLKRATPRGSIRLGSVKLDKSAVTLTLHLEQDAQDLMDRNDFDGANEEFDQDKFRDFVLGKFGNALSFLSARVPDWPSSELHVLITDMGEDRHRFPSFFVRGSRVLMVDVRVWEDIQRRNSIHSEVMPVHELTHYLQGVSAPREPAYHRELAACVVEIVYLRHRIGETEPAFVDYALSSGPLPLAQEVTDPQKLAYPEQFDYVVLRHLAHKLIFSTLRGNYKFAPAVTTKAPKQSAVEEAKTKREALVANLERFAIRYAHHPQTGSAGFDATCREVGLRDAQNQPLTLDTLRRDLARDLTTALPATK